MADMAPRPWGYPVLRSTAERNTRFPRPSVEQRVHNKETGRIERYDGTQWVVDFETTASVLPGDDRTTDTLSALLANNTPFNPLDYLDPDTAFENGVTAMDDAVAACLAAAPAGATVVFPRGLSFKFTDAIAVTKAVTFEMAGATLTQATAGKNLFECAASDCHWNGGRLVGPQYAAMATENAIQVIGASAASPVTDISVQGVKIDTWGFHGVYLQYVEEFDVSRNRLQNIYYAGIGTASAIRGTVERNRVKNVIGTPNAYGIYFSRKSTASLSSDPRSADISCTGNIVRGVTNWEGIDTHAGQRITIANNSVSACFVGILVGGQTDGTNPAFAPLEVTVSGNTIDAEVDDGSASYGIAFVGAQGTVGAPVESATGSITGNTIRRHGQQSVTLAAALYIHDTIGLTVTGNTFIEPSPYAIMLYHDNIGFTIAGNTVIDHWSTSNANPAAIAVNSDYNVGQIANTTLGIGSKSATAVRTLGIRIAGSLTNSSVILGPNSMSAATTPYSISSSGAVATGTHTSPLVIGSSGSPIKRFLTATTTWDPDSLTSGSQTIQTVTVAGAALGDTALASFSLNLQGLQLTAYVSTSNTVVAVLRNETGSTVDLASGALRVDVWQH